MIDIREHYKSLKCATCMISCGCSNGCIRGDDLCEIYELRAALKKVAEKCDDLEVCAIAYGALMNMKRPTTHGQDAPTTSAR